MIPRSHLVAVFVALVAGSVPAAAQGALSTQGFGYPAGSLSTRAGAMGGGPAEIDPLSPVNPASLAAWIGSGVYAQYSPEFRTVTDQGRQDHTTTARFPVVDAALALSPRLMLGASATTFLDRSWQTTRTGYDHSGADSTQYTENFGSAGAINDVRVATAYAVTRTFWLGVAAHAFIGENRLTISRTSTDTTVATFNQQSKIEYGGSGFSAGFLWQPIRPITLGVSGRVGGTIRTYRNDTTLTSAKVPKQYGASIGFTGLPGIEIAANASWEGWSSLASLGTPGMGVTDAWDYGVGIEARGPLALGAPMPLRAGWRRRTLPFEVSGVPVRETTLSLGTGVPIAGGRSRLDVALLRATRSAVSGVSENAWTLSIGIMVRP